MFSISCVCRFSPSGFPSIRDVKMNPPRGSGLGTSPPQRLWNERPGNSERERGGTGVGRLPNTCYFCSLPWWEAVPRSREAGMSFAHSVLKRERKRENLRWLFSESVILYPTWWTPILILAFLCKRPNLLRTLLNEHVKSFQSEDKPVCMYVHFDLWEILLRSRVPSAIMPLLTSVVSQPPPPPAPQHEYFATYSLRSWSVRPIPFCILIYLIGCSVV